MPVVAGTGHRAGVWRADPAGRFAGRGLRGAEYACAWSYGPWWRGRDAPGRGGHGRRAWRGPRGGAPGFAVSRTRRRPLSSRDAPRRSHERVPGGARRLRAVHGLPPAAPPGTNGGQPGHGRAAPRVACPPSAAVPAAFRRPAGIADLGDPVSLLRLPGGRHSVVQETRYPNERDEPSCDAARRWWRRDRGAGRMRQGHGSG